MIKILVLDHSSNDVTFYIFGHHHGPPDQSCRRSLVFDHFVETLVGSENYINFFYLPLVLYFQRPFLSYQLKYNNDKVVVSVELELEKQLETEKKNRMTHNRNFLCLMRFVFVYRCGGL